MYADYSGSEYFIESEEKSMLQKKIFAFTLAEVLITLGVIGIVAAMTIAVLMPIYTKKVYVSQFEKFVSTFQNGMRQYMVDSGCSDLACTNLFNGNHDDAPWQNNMAAELPKIFKGMRVFGWYAVDYPQTYDLGGTSTGNNYISDFYAFQLADGTVISIDDDDNGNCAFFPTPLVSDSKLKNACAQIFVDVNGFKSPNTFGRDIFRFHLGNDGYLYPWGGMEHNKAAGIDWKANDVWCVYENSTITAGVTGNGCAARIMENGWEMDY